MRQSGLVVNACHVGHAREFQKEGIEGQLGRGQNVAVQVLRLAHLLS